MNLKDKLKKIRWMIWLGRPVGHQGICGLLDVYAPTTAEESSRLMAKFRNWPEGTGSGAYPVPGIDGMSPCEAYLYAVRLGITWSWFTKYGRSRRRLLNWLIKQL